MDDQLGESVHLGIAGGAGLGESAGGEDEEGRDETHFR
jgi:hypothetical protein